MKFPVLGKSPLFRGLDDSEIESLLNSVNYRVRFYPGGSVAALAGEEIASVMIVLSGSMKGEMTDLAGRTIKIEDVNPPQALASAFIFGAGAKYPVNVIANVDSELLIIGKADYLTLMANDRRILSNYLTVVCTQGAVSLQEDSGFSLSIQSRESLPITSRHFPELLQAG